MLSLARACSRFSHVLPVASACSCLLLLVAACRYCGLVLLAASLVLIFTALLPLVTAFCCLMPLATACCSTSESVVALKLPHFFCFSSFFSVTEVNGTRYKLSCCLLVFCLVQAFSGWPATVSSPQPTYSGGTRVSNVCHMATPTPCRFHEPLTFDGCPVTAVERKTVCNAFSTPLLLTG